MLFLIALIVACAFSWLCAKPLKSHPTPFYITAVVVSVIMIMIAQVKPAGIPQAVNTYVIGLFNRGALAAALWCVVAYIGALPNSAKALKKQLIPVRGELSIFSALVTISHAVSYGIPYISRLTSGRPLTDSVFIVTCIICCMLMLIMIPLTVISFKTIRKKIAPKTWKSIQRIAYLFYALIYLHVMVIFIPRARIGREGAMLSVIVYSVIFLGYAVLRIHKAVMKAKKPETNSLLNIACTAVFVLTIGGLGFFSRPVKPMQTANISDTPSTTMITLEETTEPETVSPTSAQTTQIIETIPPTETIPETVTDAKAETSLSIIETTPETTAVPVNEETQAVAPETVPVVAETPAPAETAPPPTEQQTTPDSQQNNVSPQEDDNQQQDDNNQQNDDTPQNNDDNQQNIEEQQNQDNQQEEPQQQEEIPSSLIYNDGTYSSTQMGFDSQVYITVTIQNDTITDLTAECNESDMWYFENAYGTVKNAILASQSPDVDIVAESTISSNAIMNGVRDCLNQARK